MHIRRREFLGGALIGAALGSAGCSSTSRQERRRESDSRVEPSTQSQRMPVVFAGHGSPMNAILDNDWTRGFASLAQLAPKPRAILAISAHWYVDGTFLTSDAKPRTIHDFGGFPEALYEIQYPAPGKPELVSRVRQILGGARAASSGEWGLDHGTWSVLRFMYPEADVPVVQLSIDRRMQPSQHIELAKSLAELRDEGVLIFASGNAVHNLRDAFGRMRAGDGQTPDWALRFDRTLADVLSSRDTRKLISLWPDTDDGRIAHPTPDHYFPLLYAYGAAMDAEPVRHPVVGFDAGSISMRCVVFG